MRSIARAFSIAIAAIMAISSLTACSGKFRMSTSASRISENNITLKFVVGSSQSEDDRTKKLLSLVESQTGYKCETVIVQGNELDSTKKIRINVMAGDEYDFMYANSDIVYNLARSGIIKPLDDIIKSDGYEADRIFGTYLKKTYGRIYMLPELKDVHVTYYNKKIFDDAGVPYPTEGWTWEDYVETAKKLTNREKEIFGSYFLEWPVYFTFSARQKKVPQYKQDGTSNFDDPAWAQSFKFMADLGNVYKVQPDYLTYKTRKMPYDMFFEGKIGMWPAGSWILTMVSDVTKYPRDWKIGIAPLPQVKRNEKITLGTLGGYAMVATTRHEKETFEALRIIAERAYTVCTDLPCRVNLGEEDMQKIAEQVASQLVFDGITVEDIKNVILDRQMEVVPENEMGPGSYVIAYTLIARQGELYCTGQKRLEDAMKELKLKADAAIKEDQESGSR